jgi:hypothetical protein
MGERTEPEGPYREEFCYALQLVQSAGVLIRSAINQAKVVSEKSSATDLGKLKTCWLATAEIVPYTGERVCDVALIRCTLSSGNPRRVGNLVGRV